MKREDAYYYKILLSCGMDDGYDQWLNGYLETEDPLSDIVLDLSFCGSDLNRTLSCLHNYCMEGDFDDSAVCARLRCFLKEAYHSRRMSKGEVVSAMYRFATTHGDPGDFDIAVWGSMFYFEDYYSLAEEGILSWEGFDRAFHAYLDQGVPLDHDGLWKRKEKVKIHGIKRLWTSPIFLYLKRHSCPVCQNRLTVVKTVRVLASDSQEAKELDRKFGGPQYVGNVKYVWDRFFCHRCLVHYTVEEIKENDRS